MATIAERRTSPSYTVLLSSLDSETVVDVTKAVYSMNLYGSIDGFSAHGDITIREAIDKDTQSLITSLPIVGREMVVIRNLTSNPNAKKGQYNNNFFTYAVDNLIVQRDVMQYTIRFTTVQAILNQSIRVCQRFYNRKVGDIMNLVCEKIRTNLGIFQGKDDVIFKGCETNGSMNFLVPNWHPLETMIFLAANASSGKLNVGDSAGTAVADCVLYPSLKNSIIYMSSYKELFSKKEKPLVWSPSNIQGGGAEYLDAAEVVQFDSIINSQDMKSTGIAGSKVCWADFREGNKNAAGGGLLTAGITPVTFDKLLKLIKECTGQGKAGTSLHSPVYTNENIYKIIPYNIHEQQSDNMWMNVIYPRYMYGQSLHLAMRMKKASFQIRGDESLDLGDVVTINVSNKALNFLSSCKWVICDIQHSITPDKFDTYLTCFSPEGSIDKAFEYNIREMKQIEEAAQGQDSQTILYTVPGV